MRMKCFECAAPADEEHHVIPRSLGGTKTIPLCNSCHAKVHGMEGRRDNHSYLTKLGLKRAKERGVKLGGNYKLTSQDRDKAILSMKTKAANNENNILAKDRLKKIQTKSMTLRAIAKTLNDEGYRTSRGKKFQATSVKRLLDQLKNQIE